MTLVKSLTLAASLSALSLFAPSSSAQLLSSPAAQALPAGTYTEITGDHAIGPADAPVMMIIYASVTCPHCAAWFNDVWPELKTNYVDTGKLRFIFREFPTSPSSLAAANFALAACAGEDSYFSVIEYQMATQEAMFKILQDESLTDQVKVAQILSDRAQNAGLDASAQDACLQDQSNYDRLNTTVAQARAAQIQGVPGFIINGESYNSDSGSLAALSTVIDAVIGAN